jgi:hypothetical protein
METANHVWIVWVGVRAIEAADAKPMQLTIFEVFY